MSQLPAPAVALLVALMMRTAAFPVVGVVNWSLKVVKRGDACVPVTNTVYVPLAANAGLKPDRLVVELAVRTTSCGFELFTRVHELVCPNAMLLLPVPTVPFSAISRFSPPDVALKNRTVVLSFPV